jgi:hypothetical protein
MTFYWSSITTSNPWDAWGVHFDGSFGYVYIGNKTLPLHVRAVRSGP